ncbi:MAG: nitroreductase family protein [Thermoanaerobaculia bacterium]
MVTHAELHVLLSQRRSVRRFKPEMPPRQLIEALISSAITAPSASNKQPWRFLVVQRRELIDCMAAEVRKAVDCIAQMIDPAFEEAFRAYGDYFTRFENAPLTIVPLFRPLTVLSNMIANEDATAIRAMERDSGLIGASLAIENLLLAAHAAGLGASGMTGPLIAMQALRDLLHVPPSWEIAALIPIGYPDETPQATSRKSAEKVTQWIE